MAFDFGELQKVLSDLETREGKQKEIRKAVARVHSLSEQLQVAISDLGQLTSGGDAPAKEKKPYTGKPRGRRPKNAADTDANLFVDNTTENTVITPEDAGLTGALKENVAARENLTNTIEEVSQTLSNPKKRKGK